MLIPSQNRRDPPISIRPKPHTAKFLTAILCAASLSALGFEAATYNWRLPPGFPPPPVPADNPMLPAKVELGRHIFYDPRLSLNGEGSCSSCHIQHYGFTDQRPVAIGVTGQPHPRRAMPLANVAWFAVFNWANPTVTQLEDQSITPLFNTHPLELGLNPQTDKFLQTLQTDPTYQTLLPQAFPTHQGPFTFLEVRQALAAFERTLISGNSPYDHYRYRHEPNAISVAAKRGEDIFFHQPYSCSRCHGGFTLGGETIFQTTDGAHAIEFQNNGLYPTYPPNNQGLAEFTHNPADIGKFRPPSLRNVAVRAPYMHDGSLRTLDQVLDHYARGGSKGPNQSQFVPGFPLSPTQRADLKAFLESLTDEEFLHNPNFANPWPNTLPQTNSPRDSKPSLR